MCLFVSLFVSPSPSFLPCLSSLSLVPSSLLCLLFVFSLLVYPSPDVGSEFFLSLFNTCLFFVYFSSFRPFGVPRPQILSFFVYLFFVHSFFVCPSCIFSPSYVPCLIFVYSSSIVSSKFVFFTHSIPFYAPFVLVCSLSFVPCLYSLVPLFPFFLIFFGILYSLVPSPFSFLWAFVYSPVLFPSYSLVFVYSPVPIPSYFLVFVYIPSYPL